MGQLRELLRNGEVDAAVAIASSLTSHPETEDLGRLGSGVVASHRGFDELAWHELRGLPSEVWSRHAMGEYLRVGLARDPERAAAEVRRLLTERPSHMLPVQWMEVLERVFGHGHMDLVDEVSVVLDEAIAARPHVDERLLVKRDWIQRWTSRRPDQPSGLSEADVSFAVVDYDHPGRRRASANIGDHVQTLASMGHLVRHQDLTYDGDPDLVALAQHLRGRVRESRRLHDSDATVQLLTINRDASEFDRVPENTWVLAFGWYMHALFGVRYGLPMHRNLNPIFVSFHCNKRGLLTPEAIDWMRAHGPIGCRDWTTVDILLSVDVPAFFSGCLTTTIDTVFPDIPDDFPTGAPVAYVDAPAEAEAAGPEAITYRHSSDEVRFRSFAANMGEAERLLETYRREHSAVVSSRLHCYLPMRSLGATVDFRPKNLSDVRFAGLAGIDDAAFDVIREGINTKLEDVLGLALGGAAADEVYARWRELCAPDVAAAQARRAAEPKPRPELDLALDVDRVRRRVSTAGPAPVGSGTHHVVVRGGRRRAVVNVLLDSLTRRASAPLHVWVLDPSGTLDADDLAARAHGATVSVAPTEGLDAGLRSASRESRARIRDDLELLVLPDLLSDVERVVVLPRNALVLGDVVALAELDLGGELVAAPGVAGRTSASGFGVVHEAGDRLGDRPDLAAELRRVAHRRHRFDFTAFGLDVAVLDLQALRAAGTMSAALAMVAGYDVSPLEALHVELGPHRREVPTEWHGVPTKAPCGGALLLNWQDAGTPWKADYAPRQEDWLEARATMQRDLATTSG